VIRTSVPTLSLALLLFGSAAHAGTVYVALPGYPTVGSAAWEPVVFVSNGGAQQANFSELFLRNDTDGTVRPPAPTSQALPSKQGTGLALDSGSQGLLELYGPPTSRSQRAWSASTTTIRPSWPIVSSDNAAPAGSTLTLQGLRRGPTLATDWTLINLGWTAANCKVTAFSVDGTTIGSPATLVLKPLSSRVFVDVLQTFGLTKPSSCAAR
jgi:hypothetical protein